MAFPTKICPRFLSSLAFSRPPSSIPPSPSPSLSLLADQCKSMSQLKQIHARMILTDRFQDNYAASRLLAFCALAPYGDLRYAFQLFHSIPQPNSFMWNTLIRALATTPFPQHAFSLYVKMRRLSVTPGKHTFPFLLKASASFRSLASCKQLHVHVLKFGLFFDSHAANGLIRCYSVSGGLNHARQVFDEVPVRSLNLWTTMICGYAQTKSANHAIELFRRMTLEGFDPNEVTLASVLTACAHSGCLDLGQQIHHHIQEKGLYLNVILGTALVNMYARNGAIVQAQSCFDSMRDRNVATWNAIITGLAAHGHAKAALQFFKKLEEEKVRPSDITLVGVLSACCHAGFLDFGQRVFRSMRASYGIEPKLEHYGCMVDLLGRSGKLLEAEELIKGMQWKADVVIWGALLNACKNHENIEVAERVGKEILSLDPGNHGVCVILSNMYAEAGRWEDVLRLRKVMKEGRLRKTPGRSLVNDGP